MTTLSERKHLLPVIHTDVSHEHYFHSLMHNVNIAVQAGCEGVFLIDHNSRGRASWHGLRVAASIVKRSHPTLCVGVNFLGAEPWQAVLTTERRLGEPSPIDALWFDNPYADRSDLADDLKVLIDGIDCMIYASVGFKYQKNLTPLLSQVDNVASFTDVLVTSGQGTGKAPDLPKMEKLRQYYKKPIAIASGITIDNIDTFLPYADHFLVYSGIAAARKNPNDLTEDPPLDLEKTRALNEKILTFGL